MIKAVLALVSLIFASGSPITGMVQNASQQTIQHERTSWLQNMNEASQDIVNSALKTAFDAFVITRNGKLEALRAEDESLRSQLKLLQKSAEDIVAILRAHNQKVKAYEQLFNEKKPIFDACQLALNVSIDTYNQAEKSLDSAVHQLKQCIAEQNAQEAQIKQLIDEHNRIVDQELNPLRDRTIQAFETQKNAFESNVAAQQQRLAEYREWESGQIAHSQRLKDEGQYRIDLQRNALRDYVNAHNGQYYTQSEADNIKFEMQRKENEIMHTKAEIEGALQRIKSDVDARSQQIKDNAEYLNQEKSRIEREHTTAMQEVDRRSQTSLAGPKRDIESAKSELQRRTKFIEEQYCVDLHFIQGILENRKPNQSSATFGNVPLGPKGEEIRSLCAASSLNHIAIRANEAQLQAIEKELEDARKGWVSEERGKQLESQLQNKQKDIDQLVEKIQRIGETFKAEDARVPDVNEGARHVEEAMSYGALLSRSLAIDIGICQTMTDTNGPSEELLAERAALLAEITGHPYHAKYENNPCFLESLFRRCLESSECEETVFHDPESATFDFDRIKSVPDSRKFPLLLHWFNKNKGLWNHGPQAALACCPPFSNQEGVAFQAAWSAYSTAQQCKLYELHQDNPAYILSDDLKFLALLDSGEVEELIESWTPHTKSETEIGRQLHDILGALKIQFSKASTLDPQQLRQFALAHSLIQEADRLLEANKEAEAQEWILISKTLLRTGADLLAGHYVEIAECIYGLVYGRDFNGKILTQEDRIIQIIGLAWNRLDARVQSLGRIQTAVFDFAKKKRRLSDIVIPQHEIERLAKDQLIYKNIKHQNNQKLFVRTQLYIQEIERVS